VEPMTRREPRVGNFLHYQSAHNEYLEALVEGGLVRLALTLYLVLATLWRGWRFLARPWGPRHGRVLGLFWALTAVAVHSFFDFGIHIPAIALLTAVVAAHLNELSGKAPG